MLVLNSLIWVQKNGKKLQGKNIRKSVKSEKLKILDSFLPITFFITYLIAHFILSKFRVDMLEKWTLSKILKKVKT